VPDKIEHLIARNVIDLRNDRGWTQSELASRMRGAGFSNWQQNRVTQIETMRRPVALLEVIVLSWVFGVPLARLFQGDGDVEFPDGESVPLGRLQALVMGDVPSVRPVPWAHEGPATDELRKIAKQLDLPVHVVDWLATSVYKRPFIEEREVRLGDVSGLAKRSVQTKRGNVTRIMIGELSGYIMAQGGPGNMWRTYLASTGSRPAPGAESGH
jgi:transcriptional regulator with XRE-family HTH domain